MKLSPFDSIVTPSIRPVTVTMFTDAGAVANGEVELLVDGVSQGTGTTIGGKCTFPSVSLNTVGKHVFGGSTRRTVNGTLIEGTIIPQQVHIRDDIVSRGKHFFIQETAAEQADSLALRTRDLEVALGLIAVHEVGHTLGLVIHPNLIEELASQYNVPMAEAIDFAEDIGVTFPLGGSPRLPSRTQLPGTKRSACVALWRGFDVMDDRASQALTFSVEWREGHAGPTRRGETKGIFGDSAQSGDHNAGGSK